MKEISKISAFGIILFIAIFQSVRVSRKEYKNETLGRIIDERNATVERVKLSNGKVISEKVRVTGAFEDLSRGYIYLEDSLKEMGIKKKELESALFLSRQTRGSGTGRIDTILIEDTDTVYIGRQILINKPFFEFSATIYPWNHYKYQYTIKDSLSVVNTIERKNIFSAREYKVKVYNANPETVVTGMTSLTIKERQYKWSVGVMAGYGIGANGLSPFVGVGIMRPLIRF